MRVEALFAVGYKHQEDGQYLKAIGAYQEAIRRDPRHVSAHNNLGNCFRSIGEYEIALQCFDNSLALEPGKSSARLNKSLALLALNRYAEAWEMYRHRQDVIDCRKRSAHLGKTGVGRSKTWVRTKNFSSTVIRGWVTNFKLCAT